MSDKYKSGMPPEKTFLSVDAVLYVISAMSFAFHGLVYFKISSGRKCPVTLKDLSVLKGGDRKASCENHVGRVNRKSDIGKCFL